MAFYPRRQFRFVRLQSTVPRFTSARLVEVCGVSLTLVHNDNRQYEPSRFFVARLRRHRHGIRTGGDIHQCWSRMDPFSILTFEGEWNCGANHTQRVSTLLERCRFTSVSRSQYVCDQHSGHDRLTGDRGLCIAAKLRESETQSSDPGQ